MNTTRRRFFGLCGVIAAAGAAGISGLIGATQGWRLRTITYNVLGCKGYAEYPKATPYLKKAEAQIPARIAQELALYEPDIITFQEGPPEEVVRQIADRLGMQYGVFPSGWKGSRSYPVGFPGAVLTRFKIKSVQNCPTAGGKRDEELFTRHWGRAVLETDKGELIVYSAHLHPSEDAVRSLEITEALKVMRQDLEHDVPLLFQGDLNHKPDGADYPRWVAAGLVDTFKGEAQGIAETFGSHRPEKRIDYVWAHGPLAKRRTECRVLFEGAFRTNLEDPRSFALSDHIPVMATFL